jgi:hypothetical protein
MENDPTLVGSDEASEMLGVHRATFLRWVADELIKPAHQLPGSNGAYLFYQADVIALRDKRAEQAKATA